MNKTQKRIIVEQPSANFLQMVDKLRLRKKALLEEMRAQRDYAIEVK